MQHNLFKYVLSAAVLSAAMAGGLAQAQQAKPEQTSTPCHIKVEDAWVRATVPRQKGTGAFMRLTSDEDCQIVAVQSPIAGVAQIHRIETEGGTMRMHAIEGGLPLPAGQTVELAPGGVHIMLMDLKQDVSEAPADTRIPITLHLQNQKTGERGQHSVDAPLRPLGAHAGDTAHGTKNQADHMAH